MISINLNMSTTLPEATFILSYICNCKKRAQICFFDYSFIIKALGEKGCGWIKKL